MGKNYRYKLAGWFIDYGNIEKSMNEKLGIHC